MLSFSCARSHLVVNVLAYVAEENVLIQLKKRSRLAVNVLVLAVKHILAAAAAALAAAADVAAVAAAVKKLFLLPWCAGQLLLWCVG